MYIFSAPSSKVGPGGLNVMGFQVESGRLAPPARLGHGAKVLQDRQGPVQVCRQVVGIFQPDRQAEERIPGPLPVAAQVLVV